ncbi:hypothetical protein LFYK43_00970 [Ligilactobacillus salitolerans]|uniref:DUF5626 domain-containing protein n=1 Tax=Ligilactobacillus salitolerans TaxID=1808352 RepID=A0A401IQ26_9LACO|nr:DUF5626 family protein [Ligilactobacillus salitolerans]GBG93638.1 hypothetical protein LFYK43_00970 [Ligilactobacillus salitolerans]
MKKIYLLLAAIIAVVSLGTFTASANTVSQGQITYNLKQGGTQVFETADTQNNPIEYVVSEDKDDFTSSLIRLSNKNYTITKKGIGWHVSYKIKVSGNSIKQAFGLNAVATKGSFKSSLLAKISNKKAQWRAKYKFGLVTTVSCTAKISGTKLYVS